MYCLEAVVGSELVLRELAWGTHLVPLSGELWLLPVTDFAVVPRVVGELPGFWKAPDGAGAVLAACSGAGPVAYVEAEYFGGVGQQAAQVWDGGAVVLGPLWLGMGSPLPAAGGPISRALRRLGVVKGEHFDEFDAVGLGRRRRTGDWLPVGA
ncbi:hypothetical protein ACQPZF_05225 [Actinosynnema sp. CS-041913]|uniref:hypothetical protein n=1 Tax=Actinosynnema sp. CS-041913 TaxID=3239917 RepID=UPI003D8D3928